MRILILFIVAVFSCYSQTLKSIAWNSKTGKYVDKVSGLVLEEIVEHKGRIKSPLLTISYSSVTSSEGLDFSIKHRYLKPNYTFLESHSGVTFGLHEGYVYLKYYYENDAGDVFQMVQSHIWKTPVDSLFHHYRFVFDNNTKEARIIVDCKTIWRFSAENHSKIFWHEDDKIILCEGNIHHTNQTHFDLINFTIREKDNGSAFVFDECYNNSLNSALIAK